MIKVTIFGLLSLDSKTPKQMIEYSDLQKRRMSMNCEQVSPHTYFISLNFYLHLTSIFWLTLKPDSIPNKFTSNVNKGVWEYEGTIYCSKPNQWKGYVNLVINDLKK